MRDKNLRRLEGLENRLKNPLNHPPLVWIGPDDSPKPEGWDSAKNRIRIRHDIVDPDPDTYGCSR